MLFKQLLAFLSLILFTVSCEEPNQTNNTSQQDKAKQASNHIPTIRIFREKSAGLRSDYSILRSRLSPQFHVVSQEEDAGMVDVNIFQEVVHQDFVPKAKQNLLLANQEQIGAAKLYRNIDKVLCKTKLCMKIMETFKNEHALTYELQFLGFTSEVVSDPNMKKDYNLFVHLAGKSPHKNTGLVLETWRKHPNLPRLVVTCIDANEPWDCYHTQLIGENSPDKIKAHSNISLHTSFLPLEETRALMNTAGFFITPSQVEGYGHYLNEGRGTGAINITIDAPPMNEMIDRNSGFLVPSKTLPETMGEARSPLFVFDSKDLYTQVSKALNTDNGMKQFLSERTRLKFELDSEVFEKNLKKLFNPSSVAETDEHALPEDFGPVEIPNKHFKVGIVMTVWERPDVLKTTVQSLESSGLKDDVIFIVVDDKSKSEETYNIIRDFKLSKATLVKIRLLKNEGLLKSMLTGMNLIADKVDYIMNLDPDVYVKKHWIKTLLATFDHIKAEKKDDSFLLTGFNTQSHKTVGCEEMSEYQEIQLKCCSKVNAHQFSCPKKDVGGVNFVFSSNFYNGHVRGLYETLLKGNWKAWDWDLVHDFEKNQFGMFATSPSVLQHLGTRGTNARPDQHVDFAEDF